MFWLVFTIISSTRAWGPASHILSPESTIDWKQKEVPSITFHVWWDKIREPWKKGQVVDEDLQTVSTSSSTTTSMMDKKEPPSFFIRPALTADLGRASKILADGFFKDKTNFITFQIERLETYLSLEVGFPRPNTRHQVFVACEMSTGKVLGVAEVDARIERPPVPKGGPYLCNLAVDLDYLRLGIASALVKECEAQVQKWICDESREAEILKEDELDQEDATEPSSPRLSSSLHLKVRPDNEKAIKMYQKLGYESLMYETEKKGEKVLVMRKQLEHLEEKKLGVAIDGGVNAVR